MDVSGNLLGGPPPTHLPVDPAAALLDGGAAPSTVAAEHPTSSLAWARLAEDALAGAGDAPGAAVTSYAYARTGYHRGLDQLRRAGWKGHGPIPWEHQPNQGFLRALAALALAATAIGEADEAERCRQFLQDSDAVAAELLLPGG